MEIGNPKCEFHKIRVEKARKIRPGDPDWKTPPYYFHMSLRWNFEVL